MKTAQIQPRPSYWYIDEAKNTTRMFSDCYKFNQDISCWDLSQIAYKKDMFYQCFSMQKENLPKGIVTLDKE
ncbi:MAG: BspA family leucine-rich repeat surface protein [Candidatus Thiodubiliella endoseptemdiera]|uniref:BspA family leucine-rich repeat surface protein n=1 Tax=Candidatus Thiodubiliella endoseptemdiera TaxID=2738886 RepID=A0A853F8W6_9GAMM|nr:BspA family leucine-rich repeat surface protein [Candidatus Thiodubiliella endoseptemdiera]